MEQMWAVKKKKKLLQDDYLACAGGMGLRSKPSKIFTKSYHHSF